jgi:hypothetical protein
MLGTGFSGIAAGFRFSETETAMISLIIVAIASGSPVRERCTRRPAGQRRGSEVRAVPQFNAELERLGLQKPRAIEAQRISALPEKEKAKLRGSRRARGVADGRAVEEDPARHGGENTSRAGSNFQSELKSV